MKRKQSAKVSITERQRKALSALYHWEFWASMSASERDILKRVDFIRRAHALLAKDPNARIEYLTKDAQLAALEDVMEARGIEELPF